MTLAARVLVLLAALFTLPAHAEQYPLIPSIAATDFFRVFRPNSVYELYVTPPGLVSYILGTGLPSPPPIGNVTPNTGAFTSLTASGTVSGTGFVSLFASPPPIGSSVRASGAFTTLSATGASSFAALSASGIVSGVGFSNYLLSPPPIGSTAPNAGAFTTLSASGALTANNIVSTELPGLSANVEATGNPGLDNPNCASIATCEFMIFASPTTPSASVADTFRIQRSAGSVTGGTSGLTKGALWVLGFSGPNANEFNWNAKFELHNKTLLTTGAQNVGAQATIFKETPGGGGEVTASWGLATQCYDKQVLANPTASCVGIEADTVVLSGSGTDTGLQRVGLQISAGTFPGTDTGVHIGRALLFSIIGNSVVDHVIDILGGAGSGTWGTLWTTSAGAVTAINGLDWSNITFSGFIAKAPNLLIDNAGGYLSTPVTVASLPACSAGLKGTHRVVSDASGPTYNATAVGGGAVTRPVICDGALWKT